MKQGEPNDENTQPANDTVNTGSLGNKDKRKRACDLPTSTAQKTDTQDTKINVRKINNMYTHTGKKDKQEEERDKNTHYVRARGSPNEKNRQHTKEPATGQKGKNIRKRETMCETTHRKAKKKTKRDQDQCKKEKENVHKTS
jgi:hypothetical protein